VGEIIPLGFARGKGLARLGSAVRQCVERQSTSHADGYRIELIERG
jgi:hypothetical protein